MGNSFGKGRAIKVSNPTRRIPKDELLSLKEAFNRIQDAQMISDNQFHIEVLGPQVPESIAMKIFQLFLTTDDTLQNDNGMTFDDILACYAVFKHGYPEEMAQVCFELMKMTNGSSMTPGMGQSEYIQRDNVQLYTEKLISQNEQLVHSFYAKTEFDPRLPIRKEDFVSVFKKVQSLPMFTWVPRLVDGYSRDFLNMDEQGKSVDLMKRLTIIQHERARTEAERLGFTSIEHDNMQEFFNREMKKNDAKAVMKTIEFMYKDIENVKFRRYFIDAMTKHKSLDFKCLTNIAFAMCKERDEEKKLNFLFDIFSCYSDSMKKKQMRDFGDFFNFGQGYFNQRGATVSRLDFIADLSGMTLDHTIYEKCKFTLIAMLGLTPEDEIQEKEAIRAVLNNNHNIEAYIFDHLDSEDTYFVMNKHFFDAWSQNVGFENSLEKSATMNIKKEEKMKIIDNASLVENMHSLRLKDVQYGVDFILVPRFVFFPLSKWYKCNKIIERKVISYKQDREYALNKFKNKKQPTSNQNVSVQHEHFFKNIEDITFELELYPKFLYFEKVNEKGEKPHQKAILNQKIDPNYVKKVMKSSDKLPFFELLISRKATFEEVLKQMSQLMNENYKRGRLWIEDQIISGAKLEENLDQFGISMGQVIYAEYSNNSNQWPTDIAQAQTKKTTDDGRDSLKTNGLYNLGNTCYMNSALQCLANTKFFNEFFIREKRYLKQMNLKSKMGHQGELASNFAQLMQKMWQQGQVVVPRQFKNSISTISEQFQGYDQQDSQEFLSFLLDGLHEELNLRQEKPYIENPDSDNRNVVDLGLESWSNALRRDWSFIYFLFFGQLKSTLNCQACNKVSITFDNINSIPLSLPEPSKILINIIVYRLPSDIKALINGHTNLMRAQTLQKVDSFRSDDPNVPTIDQEEIGLKTRTTPMPDGDHQFQESIKNLMNNQPIHISLRIDKEMKISQIIQQICNIPEVNIDLLTKNSQVCLFSQTKGILRGIFNPDYKLTQYSVASNEIEAVEFVTRQGRDTIREVYHKNPDLLEVYENTYLTTLTQASEKIIEDPYKQTLTSSSTTASKKQKTANRNQPQRDSNYGAKISQYNLFNSHIIALEKYQEYEDSLNFPDHIFSIAYHRRFVKKSHTFFCQYQPQLFSSPIILMMPLKPTGKRIYDEIWALASNILKTTSIYHDKRNRWWEQKNWEDKLQEGTANEETFKPFILKSVDRNGYSCSSCDWMKMCSGCIIKPTEEFVEDFLKKIHIAIEWHSSLIEEDYNHQVNEVIHHASTQDKQIQEDGHINLEDCLRKFQEVEEMVLADHIICGNCKKPQGHLKKLEIFRPPPILIVQLKRFKFANTFRNKLTTLVEFPLYNLDLSSFVTEQDLISKIGIDLQYDLYGIINHYGSLHFGHYTSIVRNLQENKWYQYDDSSRTQIQEDQINKESAYILFYVRKDVQSKKLDDIFPHIQEFFPGKPVATEKGNGFIIEKQSDGILKVQYEKGKDTENVTTDQIKEEKDSNEIIYDAKQLQEIESHKKERLVELMKNRKSHVTGRCRAVCSGMIYFCATSANQAGKRNKSIRRGGIKSSMTRQGDCNIF